MAVIGTITAVPTNFGSGGGGLTPNDSSGKPSLKTLLAELQAAVAALDAAAVNAPAMQAVNATLVAGTVTIAAGIVVAATSEVIPLLIGALTGSTNFASLGELKASRVNGGAGVGSVVIQAYGADGALDADAAGAIRVLVLTKP